MKKDGSIKYNILAVTGPTATGKTALAAHLAFRLGGEVISADSRQVYRGMDIGTGKDLDDYVVEGTRIPVHLIDIVDAGYQYNVFEFKRDFQKVMADLRARAKFPVLCGGSGLYIEAVLRDYRLIEVPVNEMLRAELKGKSLEELTTILKTYKSNLHNITDIVNTKRAIRAIEIEDYYQNLNINTIPSECQSLPDGASPSLSPSFSQSLSPLVSQSLSPLVSQSLSPSFSQSLSPLVSPSLSPLIVALHFDVETRRKRITERLHQRLNQGMIEEVGGLLRSGIAPEALTYYGLEYKFITLYLTGELTRQEMIQKLNIAIHQFAKRQMTWFRKMEREGTIIHWIDGNLTLEEKVNQVLELMQTRQES
ncbi:MAG TPA: tRNA (adenosine(37)-N6)-dimethylallyltransferase MiaA [Prolixibacteraceae bacterium]|nr:tRNA (adenosine(37)-N6)-dimethylallyltransferase MiaA [Prolixibacteraceae bacterium]